MMDETAPVTRLEDPLPIEKILNRNAEFSIKSNDALDEEEDTDITKVYPYDSLMPYYLKEAVEVASGDDGDEKNGVDETLTCFSVFQKRMSYVTEDGKVMKEIEIPGLGETMPKNDQIWCVYVHYHAYVEFGEFPFDISRLRSKKPVQLLIGSDAIIEGLEIAIRSMRKGEQSKFLIHPDLAFKEKGVPPRIPPQATLLFHVELLDFCQEEKKTEPLIPLTFKEKLKNAKRLCEKGNLIKKNEKNYSRAIAKYRRAVTLLISTNYMNSEEELTARNELLRLYTNLAVCYLLKKDYKRTCSVFNDAVQDCPGLVYNNVKLLYLSAKALRFLADFNEALKRLNIASKLHRGNVDILKELQVLKNTIERTKMAEVKSCRKMFGQMKINESDVDDETLKKILGLVDDEFKREFIQILDNFTESEKRETILEDSFTRAEMDYITLVGKKRNVEIRMVRHDSSEVSHVIMIKRVF